jgi:hypothetical protein
LVLLHCFCCSAVLFLLVGAFVVTTAQSNSYHSSSRANFWNLINWWAQWKLYLPRVICVVDELLPILPPLVAVVVRNRRFKRYRVIGWSPAQLNQQNHQLSRQWLWWIIQLIVLH